jgi:ABC-type branched-subunit amino acid transport system ATPase component
MTRGVHRPDDSPSIEGYSWQSRTASDVMIHSLKLNGYRGFSKFAMDGLGRINLLVGKNNSGKTSILEALMLLAVGTDPSVLWRVVTRRGEQAIPEQAPGRAIQPELEIAHLFHGHEIKVGAEFSIATQNQKPGRSLRYRIEATKAEESPVLFAQLGQVAEEEVAASRLALKINGSPGATLPPIPLSKQMAIRQELFPHLANIARGVKSDFGTPQFITTESLNVGELLALWNNIVLTADEDRVVKALQFLDPAIERIASFNMGASVYAYSGIPSRGGFAVRMRGTESRIPIGSFGDGMWRILALAVAISRAKGNLLLVDEIDTGLHYSVMADMWKLINSAAEAFNVQVFATTHSYDCVHSLASICRDVENSQSVITIHRIEPDKPASVRFTEAQIKIAADRELEIR